MVPKAFEVHQSKSRENRGTSGFPEHKVGPRRALVQDYRASQRYNKVGHLTRCQSERRYGCSGFQRLHLGCEVI